MKNSIVIQDPQYLEERVREFKQAMRPFAQELSRLYSIIPPTGFKLNRWGEIENLPILPKYQKAIDRILWAKQKMIKESFPEFYNPDHDVILSNE